MLAVPKVAARTRPPGASRSAAAAGAVVWGAELLRLEPRDPGAAHLSLGPLLLESVKEAMSLAAELQVRTELLAQARAATAEPQELVFAEETATSR